MQSAGLQDFLARNSDSSEVLPSSSESTLTESEDESDSSTSEEVEEFLFEFKLTEAQCRALG